MQHERQVQAIPGNDTPLCKQNSSTATSLQSGHKCADQRLLLGLFDLKELLTEILKNSHRNKINNTFINA